MGAWKAELNRTVMRRVTREQMRESAQRQRARRTVVDVVASRTQSSHTVSYRGTVGEACLKLRKSVGHEFDLSEEQARNARNYWVS
jgi:hypothetical protein